MADDMQAQPGARPYDTVRVVRAGVFEISLASRQGPGRENNEDAVFSNPETGVHLVADGVGGLPYGEVASWEIVQACTAIHAADLSFMDRLEWLEDRLLAANHTLYQAGMTAPQAFTMASTVVAAQVEDDRAGLFWAGDSRAYLRHHGRLVQLTTDHVELRDRRRLVTRLVGATPDPELDFRIVQIDPGARLLLCTDGIFDAVPPEVIGATLDLERRDLATALLEAADCYSGRDDATAIVLRHVGGTP